jgi:hypothetical protein
MAELFPMAQAAQVRPEAMPSSTAVPLSATSLAGPPHVVRITDTEHTSRSGSTPSSGHTTLSLSTAGSQSRLSTDDVLAEMRAQMAVHRKQQATDRRDETYRKYRMEKLPPFHDLEEWDIWWRKTRNMLGHEAWGNILVKPWETTPENESLSRELYMRLATALNKTTGVIMNGRDDLDRLGLEILHLLHHEYSPTDTLTLPTVFNEWNTLRQHKTETASAFAGRVRTLAQRSQRCGRTYTEPSIILTFLCGLNSNFEGFIRDYHTGHHNVTTAKLANVVQTASLLEKNHKGKQGTLAKQATKSTDGKPSGSTSAKTPSSCIGYEVFKTLSVQHTCPIHGKGHNHQLGECQSLLFELNKRGFEVARKDGKPNLSRANKASSKDKTAPKTTPDETSVSGIVAAGKMARSSTYADAAQQVSAPAVTSSVATGTTADLGALDSLDLDFGCSFMAETGPNDTRTDTTFYLAPPATHLEPRAYILVDHRKTPMDPHRPTRPWDQALEYPSLEHDRPPAPTLASSVSHHRHCPQCGSIPMSRPHCTGQDQPSDATSMHP